MHQLLFLVKGAAFSGGSSRVAFSLSPCFKERIQFQALLNRNPGEATKLSNSTLIEQTLSAMATQMLCNRSAVSLSTHPQHLDAPMLISGDLGSLLALLL